MASSNMRESSLCDKDLNGTILGALYQQKQISTFCDVIMKVCGRDIYAHSNVLAAASPYFQTFLTQDLPRQFSQRAPQVIEIQIDGSEPSQVYEEAVAVVIDFIYTGKMGVRENNMGQVIEIARIMQMENIVKFCENFIQGQATGDVVVRHENADGSPSSCLIKTDASTNTESTEKSSSLPSSSFQAKIRSRKLTSVATQVMPYFIPGVAKPLETKDVGCSTDERYFEKMAYDAEQERLRPKKRRGRPPKSKTRTDLPPLTESDLHGVSTLLTASEVVHFMEEKNMSMPVENMDHAKDSDEKNKQVCGMVEFENGKEHLETFEVEQTSDIQGIQHYKDNIVNTVLNENDGLLQTINDLEGPKEARSQTSQFNQETNFEKTQTHSHSVVDTPSLRRSSRTPKPSEKVRGSQRRKLVSSDEAPSKRMKVERPIKTAVQPLREESYEEQQEKAVVGQDGQTGEMSQEETSALIAALVGEPSEPTTDTQNKNTEEVCAEEATTEQEGNHEETASGIACQVSDSAEAEASASLEEAEEAELCQQEVPSMNDSEQDGEDKKASGPVLRNVDVQYVSHQLEPHHLREHEAEEDDDEGEDDEEEDEDDEDLSRAYDVEFGEEELEAYQTDMPEKRPHRTPLTKTVSDASTGLMPGKFQCDMCAFNTNKVREMSAHVKLHKFETNTCYYCEQIFEDRDALTRHIDTHTGPNPFYCPVCNMCFKSHTILKMHLPKHSDFKPYICEVCSQGFKWKHALKNHMVVHSNKKEHLCDICGYATAHKNQLKAHKLIHTGDTYRCSMENCNFQATKIQNLKYHMLTHTGEKPHQCEVCGQSFSLVKNMKRHMLLHTVEKKQKCIKCEYMSTRVDKLREHLLKQHGVGSPPEKRMRVSDMVIMNSRGVIIGKGRRNAQVIKTEEGDTNVQVTYAFADIPEVSDAETVFRCSQCEYTCTGFEPLKVHLTKVHSILVQPMQPVLSPLVTADADQIISIMPKKEEVVHGTVLPPGEIVQGTVLPAGEIVHGTVLPPGEVMSHPVGAVLQPSMQAMEIIQQDGTTQSYQIIPNEGQTILIAQAQEDSSMSALSALQGAALAEVHVTMAGGDDAIQTVQTIQSLAEACDSDAGVVTLDQSQVVLSEAGDGSYQSATQYAEVMTDFL